MNEDKFKEEITRQIFRLTKNFFILGILIGLFFPFFIIGFISLIRFFL